MKPSKTASPSGIKMEVRKRDDANRHVISIVYSLLLFFISPRLETVLKWPDNRLLPEERKIYPFLVLYLKLTFGFPL